MRFLQRELSWSGGAPLQPMPRRVAARPRQGAALLGTARSCRGTVPFTHLAREGRMTVTTGRRELLAALGGAAAWALAARAQQPRPMRRLAIIMLTADDADGQARITALREGLEKLGWTAHNG